MVLYINYRSTDSKQYLDYSSNHPNTLKTFSLARRIFTIINKGNLKNVRLEELLCFIVTKLSYKQELQKAKTVPIEELRTAKEDKRETNIISYVSAANPNGDDNSSKIPTKWNKHSKGENNKIKNIVLPS